MNARLYRTQATSNSDKKYMGQWMNRVDNTASRSSYTNGIRCNNHTCAAIQPTASVGCFRACIALVINSDQRVDYQRRIITLFIDNIRCTEATYFALNFLFDKLQRMTMRCAILIIPWIMCLSSGFFTATTYFKPIQPLYLVQYKTHKRGRSSICNRNGLW